MGSIGNTFGTFNPASSETNDGVSNAPQLSSAPQLPPLNTTSITNLPLDQDPDSPTTPDSPIMAQYADPTNLPGPTGRTARGGVRYGTSIEVPKDKAQDYDVTRQHMARGGEKATKYLAIAENNPGVTEVYPYNSSDSQGSSIRLLDGTKYQMQYEADFDPGSGLAYFPTDQAMLHTNGELSSAASIGSHEVGHVARNKIGSLPHEVGHVARSKIGSLPFAESPVPNYANREEFNTIKKIENPVAIGNGESNVGRDEHSVVGYFRTDSITSTVPSKKATKKVVRNAQQTLRADTQRMHQNNVTSLDASHPLVRSRDTDVLQARVQLKNAENGTLSSGTPLTRAVVKSVSKFKGLLSTKGGTPTGSKNYAASPHVKQSMSPVDTQSAPGAVDPAGSGTSTSSVEHAESLLPEGI